MLNVCSVRKSLSNKKYVYKSTWITKGRVKKRVGLAEDIFVFTQEFLTFHCQSNDLDTFSLKFLKVDAIQKQRRNMSIKRLGMCVFQFIRVNGDSND